MADDAHPDPVWPDPTVHVPYRLRIETASGDAQVLVASFVALSSRAVLAFNPDGKCVARLDTRDVRLIEALVRELPGDYDELRAQHRNAYEPWPDDVGYVTNLGPSPGKLGQVVRWTARPVAHVLTKAAALGIDVRAVHDTTPEPEPELPPQWADATAEHARRYAKQDHLVFVRSPNIDPAEILVRHDIRSYLTEIYRIAIWGFAARLTGHETAELSADPDVERIEPDEHRLAPLFGTQNADRIEGSYLAGVRPGADPLLVATRNGIVATSVRPLTAGFSADLGDDEVDLIRRDPDVMHVECDVRITLDD